MGSWAPTVREADTSDLPAIAAVRAVTWQVAYAGLMPEEVLAPLTEPDRLATWAEAFATAQHARRLVAESATTIVGFVAFGGEREATTWRPSGTTGRGEIYAIYVLPDSWGTGAGSALLHAALDELVESGYRHVTLWVLEGNHRAIRFYERHGFVATGASREPDGLAHEVRYARRL